MNRIHFRFLVGAASVGLLGVAPSAGSAQTTFTACRVPVVGVLYLLAAPADPCLDAAHVKFSWTDGGTPADGSITSVKIADATIAAVDHAAGSVTSAGILDGTIAAADHATGSVTTTQILDGTVGAADHATGSITTTQILDATVAAADHATGSVNTASILDGTIVAADLAPGVAGYTVAIVRESALVSIPAGSTGTFVSVSCLPGEVAMGGGGVNGNISGVYLKQSYPNPLSNGAVPTGWGTSFQNTSGSAANGYAYVVCAS